MHATKKTILITGSTDGIGLETAKMLTSAGHRVLIHGRSLQKLERAKATLASLSGSARSGAGPAEGYAADLSSIKETEALATAIAERHERLDVLINNAGVFTTPHSTTPDGLDVRFVVNTIAPFVLARKLLPLMNSSGRVINLSSAAQSPVDLKALTENTRLPDFEAYAQSKLAITMWSRHLARSLGTTGPVVISVNPGSFLGTKMVKEGFGREGRDIRIGADILRRLSLDPDFEGASGQYFDNDAGKIAPPHSDALDDRKVAELVRTIEGLLKIER